MEHSTALAIPTSSTPDAETRRWLELAAEALALLGEPGARVIAHYERRDGMVIVRDVRGTPLGVAGPSGTYAADGTRRSLRAEPDLLLPSARVTH